MRTGKMSIIWTGEIVIWIWTKFKNDRYWISGFIGNKRFVSRIFLGLDGSSSTRASSSKSGMMSKSPTTVTYSVEQRKYASNKSTNSWRHRELRHGHLRCKTFSRWVCCFRKSFFTRFTTSLLFGSSCSTLVRLSMTSTRLKIQS